METELIYVPVKARGQRIEALPISARLKKILHRAMIRVLGDLHNRSFWQVQKLTNCGPKSVAELREIITSLQPRGLDERGAGDPHGRRIPRDEFLIAENIRPLKFSDLPISERIAGLVKKARLRRLGDLHRRTPSELLRYRNCGRRTIQELWRIIARAEQGEFNSVPCDTATAPVVLVRLLEAGLEKLDERDRHLLLNRIGGGQLPPQTLEQLGQREGLTRERVRQVLEIQFTLLRKISGPQIPRLLQMIRERCLSALCPLTPELLNEWLTQQGFAPTYPAPAYVRLFGALDKNIPGWPNGHDGRGPRDAKAKQFSSKLAEMLWRAGGEMTIAEARRQLGKLAPFKQLDRIEFLRYLRAASQVTVTFAEPGQPKVRLKRSPARPLAVSIPSHSKSS